MMLHQNCFLYMIGRIFPNSTWKFLYLEISSHSCTQQNKCLGYAVLPIREIFLKKISIMKVTGNTLGKHMRHVKFASFLLSLRSSTRMECQFYAQSWGTKYPLIQMSRPPWQCPVKDFYSHPLSCAIFEPGTII